MEDGHECNVIESDSVVIRYLDTYDNNVCSD